MPNNIYNVKQAAKILGLSTNTTYKYLNEGRIKAARGHIRGTFIITAKSLENFLGSKLPEESLTLPSDTVTIKTDFKDAEAIIEVAPPTIAVKVTRILITLILLLTIADIIFTKDFSPINQVGRIVAITLGIILSYQFGGFIKK